MSLQPEYNFGLIEARMGNQSFLCQEFDCLLQEKLQKAITSIEQQTVFYELAAVKNKDKADYFSAKAANMEILNAEQLIDDAIVMMKSMNAKVKYENERQHRRKQRGFQLHYLSITQLLFQFQSDIRKTEAELIKVNMITQSSLFQKLINFMQQILYINNALIRQQTKLYELAIINENQVDYFLNKADSIKILNTQQLIHFFSQKIKDLNLENAKEIEYLEFKLELLRINGS